MITQKRTAKSKAKKLTGWNAQVIEVYKGVKIRRHNTVRFKFGIAAFKKLIDEVEHTGLSIQKVIAYSGQPCERCKDTGIIILISNGESVKIKRGLLDVPENNGTNIIKSNFIQSQCKKQSN